MHLCCFKQMRMDEKAGETRSIPAKACPSVFSNVVTLSPTSVYILYAQTTFPIVPQCNIFQFSWWKFESLKNIRVCIVLLTRFIKINAVCVVCVFFFRRIRIFIDFNCCYCCSCWFSVGFFSFFFSWTSPLLLFLRRSCFIL